MRRTPQELYVKTVYYRDFAKLQASKDKQKLYLVVTHHATVDITIKDFMSMLR